MNDLFLTGMNRRSRNSVESQRKRLRRRARDGLHRVLGAIDALVVADDTQTVTAFRDSLGTPALIEAAIACRAYERLEERGHLDAMLARYGTLRQYLPAFFALPFQAAAGSEMLLNAIEIVRALDAGTRGALTTDDPHGFVQADWRPIWSQAANSIGPFGKSHSPLRSVTPCAPAVCSCCKAATTSRSGTWSRRPQLAADTRTSLSAPRSAGRRAGCSWPCSLPNSIALCAPRNADCHETASRRSKMAGSQEARRHADPPCAA
jgi:hypothetical protein